MMIIFRIVDATRFVLWRRRAVEESKSASPWEERAVQRPARTQPALSPLVKGEEPPKSGKKHKFMTGESRKILMPVLLTRLRLPEGRSCFKLCNLSQVEHIGLVLCKLEASVTAHHVLIPPHQITKALISSNSNTSSLLFQLMRCTRD